MRNLTLRTETRVGGTPVDFGVLSARSVVTGSDGKATLVYTAPPSPAVSPDAFLVVDIVVTPFGTDFDNSSSAQRGNSAGAAGAGHPAIRSGAGFHLHAQSPARQSDGALRRLGAATGSIAEYQWNFGDGGRGSGRTDVHAYDTAGHLCRHADARRLVRPQRVHVAVADRRRRRAPPDVPHSSSRRPRPRSRPGRQLQRRAVACAAPGAASSSYTWNFGDGSRVTTGDPGVTKAFVARRDLSRSRSSSRTTRENGSVHRSSCTIVRDVGRCSHVRNTSSRRTEAPGPAGPGVHLLRGARRGVPPARHVRRGDRDLPGGTASASLRTRPRASRSAARLSRSASTTKPRPSSSRCCRALPRTWRPSVRWPTSITVAVRFPMPTTTTRRFPRRNRRPAT